MDFRQEIAAIFEEDIVAVNVCLLIVLRPSTDSWEFIPVNCCHRISCRCYVWMVAMVGNVHEKMIVSDCAVGNVTWLPLRRKGGYVEERMGEETGDYSLHLF